MAKQYLKPGMKLILHGGPATVGLSCSFADLSIDWSGMEEYGGDDGVGNIVIDGWTFNVFRDHDGRLIYYDERGF